MNLGRHLTHPVRKRLQAAELLGEVLRTGNIVDKTRLHIHRSLTAMGLPSGGIVRGTRGFFRDSGRHGGCPCRGIGSDARGY